MNQSMRKNNLLGERIKKAREIAGLSQKQVSDAMGWTSAQFISNVERGKAPLPPQHIPIIARMIKLSENRLVDDLVEIYRHRCVAAIKKAKQRKTLRESSRA
jgi:transcriptional regulator with XRE-family HTH domain